MRVTLVFALVALTAGIALTAVTYQFARTFLLDERTTSARQQANTNAGQVRDELRQDPGTIRIFFQEALRIEPDGFAFLTDPVVPTDQGFQVNDLPVALREAVGNRESGSQRFAVNGDPYLAIGLHLPGPDTGYIEAFPLAPTERTLRAVLTVLVVGTFVTTMLATFFGWSTSKRLLRPITRVADAAGAIASGGLDTRVEAEKDPDLDRLAGSFNAMVDAVQARIEREARFASDVSHELRSPITALAAAIEVLDARREDFSDRSRQALDVVVSQVRRFDDMVLDLLELSRMDAGATEVNTEEIDIVDLSRRIAARNGMADVPVDLAKRTDPIIDTDKLRYERILSNLLANAQNHAGGPTRITIGSGSASDTIQIAVDDRGDGVEPDERIRIFERFARGSAARHRVGTGLGLALVSEHAAALGGRAWVTDAPDGGARFLVEIGTGR